MGRTIGSLPRYQRSLGHLRRPSYGTGGATAAEANWVAPAGAAAEARAAVFPAEAGRPSHRRRICSTWRLAGHPTLPLVAIYRW